MMDDVNVGTTNYDQDEFVATIPPLGMGFSDNENGVSTQPSVDLQGITLPAQTDVEALKALEERLEARINDTAHPLSEKSGVKGLKQRVHNYLRAYRLAEQGWPNVETSFKYVQSQVAHANKPASTRKSKVVYVPEEISVDVVNRKYFESLSPKNLETHALIYGVINYREYADDRAGLITAIMQKQAELR
jgi:hypothetical protein